MDNTDAVALRKYADLIESMLLAAPRTPRPRAGGEPERAVPVEWGLVLPLALLGDADAASDYSHRLAALGGSGSASGVVVRDVAGHARPAYLPLLVASWARAVAIARRDETPADLQPRPLREACHRLETIVDRCTFAPGPIPAAVGATAGEAALAALALHVAATPLAEKHWPEKTARFMADVASRQQPGGALLLAGRSDNPETLWFHELVLLHALAGFAFDAGDASLIASSNRAADYHQNETQPDHATNQPWGITAFVLNPSTRPLADQVLHAVRVKSDGSPDGVSLMLLADCLYCLRSRLGLPLVGAAPR